MGRRGALAIGLLLCGAATTRAQAPLGVEDPDESAARARFARGLDHYNRSEWGAALDEFEAARRLRPSPAFDFNIARCLDRLGRAAEAIAAYERYLRAVPAAEDAEMVRSRVAVLRSRTRAPEPRAPPREAPAPAGRTAGIALLSIGGAIVLGGGATLVAGLVTSGEVNQAPNLDERAARADLLRTEWIAGGLLAGVGGAAAIAGAILLARAPARHALLVLPAPGGLAAVGTF